MITLLLIIWFACGLISAGAILYSGIKLGTITVRDSLLMLLVFVLGTFGLWIVISVTWGDLKHVVIWKRRGP